jgi:type II secretory pathway component GspD/PulD (secretin)
MKRFGFLLTACMSLLAATGWGQAQQGGQLGGPQGLRRNPLLNRRPGMMRPGAAPAAAQQQAAPSDEEAKEAIKNAPKGTNGVPALVFNQAPLELVLDAYAEQCQKTIIPAPDLPKSTITLKSLEGQLLTKEEYMEAIEVTLTMNGVVLEPFGDKFLRALQRKTLRTQGNPILMNMPGKPLPEKGKVVSQMIRLVNITAEEAQKAIEGFKDPNGLFQVFERTNTILVTDTQENVNRMLEVIKDLDVATPVTEDVFVRQIEYAVATDIKTALETIVQESQKDTQKETSGAKTSGGLGFGKSTPTPQPGRLLNLNNRPGLQKPETPANTPNANLVAAVSDADRGMIRGKVLILADERSNKLIVITNKANMDFFDKVIQTLDVETTPEVQIDVIRLKYADAEDVESMLNDLIGAGGSSSSQSKNNTNANTQKGGTANSNLTRGTTQNTQQRRTGAANSPTFQNANASRLGELNKDNVKVLADKRINGIVVMARKADMRAIREVIENMDVKLSQVLLETVIVQIELGDDLSTGIDWVQRGRNRVTQNVGTGVFTQQLNSKEPYTKSDTLTTMDPPPGSGAVAGADGYWWTPNYEWVETTTPVSKLVHDSSFYNGNNMLGGGGGSASSTLASLFGAVSSNATEAAVIGANPIGGGINYYLKSDKLNIAAIIQAAKSDSKTKVLASPILMTVDNKEATIEATDMIYLFSGYQYAGNTYSGSAVRNYEKRDIGLTVKVTPKINPNGTVMLTIEETFETQGADQVVADENGQTPYATVTTRKMSSDISVENRQTIVMGGLTKKTNVDSESGIPILKDIPYIGKWLFGSVTHKEARSELLVFITPYVLDDAEASQAEALRRKKALSDPRPWEDDGWSASPLADPVSRKEQLRRFQDEWKKQDEERKTKLAIEKAKMERARKLEKMSEDERKAWLDIHKEEMEKEQKEEFEKQVEEQENLKEFVDELKKKDMEKAEKAVKEADEAAMRDNEYNKFIKEQQEKGKSLPPGETLKKDAEALKEAESKKPAAGTAAPHKEAEAKPADASKPTEQPKKDK